MAISSRVLVREDETAVIVTQPVGAMRFPRRRIESVFGSIQEVYKYKLQQLPENDFDERMKLARWCLEQKMEMEARQQLQAIMELNPKHLQAKAMLVSLDQAQVRQEMRKPDPEVQQTVRSPNRSQPPRNRPGSLDASVIQGARRAWGSPTCRSSSTCPPHKRSSEPMSLPASYILCSRRTVRDAITSITKVDSSSFRSRTRRI